MTCIYNYSRFMNSQLPNSSRCGYWQPFKSRRPQDGSQFRSISLVTNRILRDIFSLRYCVSSVILQPSPTLNLHQSHSSKQMSDDQAAMHSNITQPISDGLIQCLLIIRKLIKNWFLQNPVLYA